MIEQDIKQLQYDLNGLRNDLCDVRQEGKAGIYQLDDVFSTRYAAITSHQVMTDSRVTQLESRLNVPDNLQDDGFTHVYRLSDKARAFELMKWLRRSMPNRYDLFQEPHRITVIFDQKSDAVMFKLAWGGSETE